MSESEDFDCFLSHHPGDLAAVRALARALREHGIKVWLGEECLRPGVSRQSGREAGIRASRSVAVLLGASPLDPWAVEEMQAALSLAVQAQRLVIPVLLSDAPAEPELPLFLQERTWVDMRVDPRAPADPEAPSALERLVWGITGQPPDRTPPHRPPRGDDADSVAADCPAGTISAAADGAVFRSVWGLLSPLPVAEPVYRHHYRLTVATLGNPRLAAARGLRGMLAELAALRDTGPGRPVPSGLIEFLVRLGAEPELAAPVADWLRDQAAQQRHDQENARRRIAEEAGQRVLIVQVDDDGQTDVRGFQWFLRTRDLRPVPGVAADAPVGAPAGIQPGARPGAPVAAAGWTSFIAALRACLDALSETQAIGEVQFLVNPPLFHRPFHAIPTAGSTLGEDHVVLVRYRDRLHARPTAPMHALWCRQAAGLRGREPAELPVLPIPAPGPAAVAPIPRELGLCYARFSLPGTPCSAERRTLVHWLRSGAPYLVWSHQDPADGDWQCLAECLAACLQTAGTLGRVPAELTGCRLRQDPPAQQATLVWDDPDCHPFLTPRGIEVR